MIAPRMRIEHTETVVRFFRVDMHGQRQNHEVGHSICAVTTNMEHHSNPVYEGESVTLCKSGSTTSFKTYLVTAVASYHILPPQLFPNLSR